MPILNTNLRFCILTLAIFCFLPSSGCAQSRPKPVTKARALSALRLTSVEGWKEAISEEGRFRVLFPGIFKGGNERNTDMKGFKCFQAETNWFAYYNDFDQPRASDDAHLRVAYRGSVEALTKAGSRLLSQKDVSLNGRLGTEFVLESAGRVSYMRAFLFLRRMYTLAVDRTRVTNGDPTIPEDVQQFFDSFTYWD
jgi:hypothetical protein